MPHRHWLRGAGAAAAAPLQWRGVHTGASDAEGEADWPESLDEEEAEEGAELDEERRWQEETAQQMLAAAGTLATEAAKTLELLQTRVRLGGCGGWRRPAHPSFLPAARLCVAPSPCLLSRRPASCLPAGCRQPPLPPTAAAANRRCRRYVCAQAGLSREQAEWCLERIRNYGHPEQKV